MPAAARALASVAREHWMLLLLLVFASAVRVAVAIAYRPALLWSDSWNYLYSAYSATPVLFLPEKPVGYPLALDVLSGLARSLSLITSVQHLAGLVTGVVVYALLVRLGLGRLAATAGAAVVLLDSYAIALEQHVMSEPFFTLALVGSAYLAILAVRRSDRGAGPAAAGSGLLLAAAVTMRVVAVYAIPVWALYLVWSRVGWRPLVTGVTALAVPLLAYSGMHAVKAGSFGMLEMDGYSMYARIGQIADCQAFEVSRDLMPLCPKAQPPRSRDPVDFYLYDPRSPALRTFGDPFTATTDRRAFANGKVRDFSLAVIKGRPIAFARMLGSEFLRLFEPGAMSTLPGYDDPITFPERPRRIERRFRKTRDQYYPDYVPPAYAPAGLLVDYQRWLHTPRWLMAIFALAALVAVLVGIAARRQALIPRRREVLLLGGSGIAILIGAVTAHFEPRYLLPAVPLLVAAGVVALADMASMGRTLMGALRARTRTGTA